MATALVAFAFALAGTEASACSCGGLPSQPEALEGSRAVFEGIVLDREVPHLAILWAGIRRLLGAEPAPTLERDLGATYTFEVKAAWKGAEADTIEVVTGYGGGDCGIPFEKGQIYVVYLRPYSRTMWDTDLCWRVVPRDGASEELRVLGPPVKGNADVQ